MNFLFPDSLPSKCLPQDGTSGEDDYIYYDRENTDKSMPISAGLGRSKKEIFLADAQSEMKATEDPTIGTGDKIESDLTEETKMDIENEQLGEQKAVGEQNSPSKTAPTSQQNKQKAVNKNAAPASFKNHFGSGVKTVVARDKATGKKV